MPGLWPGILKWNKFVFLDSVLKEGLKQRREGNPALPASEEGLPLKYRLKRVILKMENWVDSNRIEANPHCTYSILYI